MKAIGKTRPEGDVFFLGIILKLRYTSPPVHQKNAWGGVKTSDFGWERHLTIRNREYRAGGGVFRTRRGSFHTDRYVTQGRHLYLAMCAPIPCHSIYTVYTSFTLYLHLYYYILIYYIIVNSVNRVLIIPRKFIPFYKVFPLKFSGNFHLHHLHHLHCS